MSEEDLTEMESAVLEEFDRPEVMDEEDMGQPMNTTKKKVTDEIESDQIVLPLIGDP